MFLFSLATRLGKTVRQLTHELDRDELIQWMAFDRLSPDIGIRTDIHAGIIATTVANSNPYASRTADVGDFIPDWSAWLTEKTPADESGKWLNWVAASGGEIK